MLLLENAGLSFVVRTSLLAGATSVVFEGIPTYPDAGRFWQVCEKYKVNQFYTAPTAIRALISAGDDFVKGMSRAEDNAE